MIIHFMLYIKIINIILVNTYKAGVSDENQIHSLGSISNSLLNRA